MSDVLERLKTALADRYTVERELGSGGMAIVYLGQDLRHERPVAIKVLRPELASVVAAERFLREIKHTAALAHPHILPLLDSGEADGLLYYVMPYVEGESLRERLNREKQLPVEESVRIAREIADALGYAHEHDLLHRDIKPENILLQAGHAVVADFGIAKALSEAGGARLTDTGISIGTPSYMSPEQAAGDTELSEVSDLYSLACVLYEMLSGEPPVVDESVHKVVSRKLLGDFRPVREALQDVPADVDAAVSTALATEPAERFASAGEFAEALGTPVGAARTKQSRRRWLPWAAAAAVVIVAAGWILFGNGAEPTVERKMLVVLPFENLSAPEDEYFADGLTDAINARLASLHGLGIISRQSAIQYKGSEKTASEIGEELGVEYILEGTVQRERPGDPTSRVRVIPQLIRITDDTHVWAETFDEEMSEVFRVQSSIAERVARSLDITLLASERRGLQAESTKDPRAYDYYLRGMEYLNVPGGHRVNLENAERLFVEAIELDSQFVLAYAALVHVQLRLYRQHGLESQRLTKMRALLDTALVLDPHLPETRLAAGHYHYSLRDYERALDEYQAALAARPGNAEFLRMVALAQRRLGRWEEAVENLQDAQKLDPRNIGIVQVLATSYMSLKRYDKAEPWLDHLLAHAPTPSSAFWKMWALISLRGDDDGAWKLFESYVAPTCADDITYFCTPFRYQERATFRVFADRCAEPMRQAQTPAPSPGTISFFLLKATALEIDGQDEKSRVYYDSLRVQAESIEEEDWQWVVPRMMAFAYVGLGRKEEAIQLADSLATSNPDPAADDAISGLRLVMDLAEIYTRAGEYDTAIDQLDYALSEPSMIAVPALRLDPIWEPLVDHPRFQALLENYE